MYGVTANQVNQKRRMMNLLQGQITAEQHGKIVRLAGWQVGRLAGWQKRLKHYHSMPLPRFNKLPSYQSL